MSFELRIKELLADNYSGSAAILEKVIKSIVVYTNGHEIDAAYLRASLNMVTARFPDLGVLNHFLQQFYDLLDQSERESWAEEKTIHKISQFISVYVREWEENIGLAAEKMVRLVPFQGKKVLLHSNSYSIHALFAHLADHKIFPAIYQTMAGPVFEGKIQARILSNLGCKVHFINEAAIGRFIHEIDFAVMGADNVFTDGFTNKVGTYPLALVCREAGKPFYVMTDSRKRAPVSFESHIKALPEPMKPSDELWQNAPEAITAENYYFELTPRNLVTAFFFEDTWWNLSDKQTLP